MIFHDITTIIRFAIRKNNADKIIFFIENLSHFRFIESIFDYFFKNNYDITVISLENPFGTRDYNNNNLSLVLLKDEKYKITTLKNLKGKLFITTTPSIGTPIFPKSQIIPKEDRPKYLYFFHSLVSPNEMYVKNSFKNFDYIFSPSDIITEQLNFLVSNKTEIFTTGYLLFNNIEVGNYSKDFDDKVLIAPTWGEKGVSQLMNNIDNLTNFIVKQKLKPVFRPHPMTDINKLNNLKGISLDQDKDLKNLHRYRHLITDFSGIALEYFYLTKRPVLFLDVSKKIKRKLGTKEKKLKLIENDMRTIIGDIISLDKISDLNSFPTIENKISLEFINEINSNVNSLENTLEALRKNNLN